MKWIGKRISFVDAKDKSTFVIYPDTPGWIKMTMGAWFSMWIVIGIIMTWSVFTFTLSEQEQVISFVFLVFWAYYAIRVGRSFSWILWGKELIKVNESKLMYKKSIRKFGKATPYLLDNIRKIKLYQPKERSFQAVWEASPWIMGGDRLEFEYLGKTIRFGKKLNEKEAKLFFNVLTKKIEERLKKLN
jgi:hypothetical protein